MLARRIVPTMLVRGRTLVKGKQFAGDRSVGHAAQAARVNAMRGVDSLMILDIAATKERRGPDLAMVHEMSESIFIPLAVGGGIRTIEDIRNLLNNGADTVVICTAAQEVPGFVKQAATKFGSQAITVSVDVRNGMVTTQCGQVALAVSPVDWAKEMVAQGAGEILLTSVDRDGMMEGYDLGLIHAVSSAVDVPLIASGGCSGYGDMYQAIRAGADAVAAGALFSFTDCTPAGAAKYLKSKGVEVRTK